MLFVFVMLVMFFWLDPRFQTETTAAVNRVESLISAQLPLFFAVVMLALLASALSWLMTNWPKRQRSQFRVVKRYWVHQ